MAVVATVSALVLGLLAAESADQLVDQSVDVGHGVRLSPPEKTHPMAVCSRAEAVGGTNRLIMAVVPLPGLGEQMLGGE